MTKINEQILSERFFSFSDREIPSILEAQFLSYRTPENILEVGCGEGGIIESLLRLDDVHHKITGVDYDGKLLSIAKLRLPSFITLKESNALNLDLPKNSYDLVYSWMVLEHVENPKIIIKEVMKVTKKGGVIFFGTIIKRSWAVYFYRRNGKFVIDPTHIHEFPNEKELYKDLIDVGLKIKKTEINIKKYSVFELCLKIFMKLGLISSTFTVRNLISDSFIFRLINKIKIAIPGFYEIQVLCIKG